jgi:hypothetical protein
MGAFMHSCEGDMLYESTNTKIPYFNAPIYLENKVPIPFLQGKNADHLDAIGKGRRDTWSHDPSSLHGKAS